MNHTMPKHIGDYNKNQMLSILRERGPTSRVELSRLLGISPTAVTRNTSQLLNKGIIKECGAEESNMGRRPVPVGLCGDFCYVVGADIVGGILKAALADLLGNIIKYYEEPIFHLKDPHAVMGLLLSRLRNIISEANVPQEKIWVVTIGTPGIFNPETGKSQHSFFMNRWEDIDIRSLVFEALSIETYIENDVNLDVIGESWKGVGKDYDNILYVKLGQGLAARLVLNGKLLRGEHNMAGEVGYMVPGLPHIDSENSFETPVKNYEHLLSNAAVCREYWELTEESSLNTISDLCALANSGDEAAKKVINRLLDQFAVVLLNSATVMDPQVIILGGDACSFGEKEVSMLKHRVEQNFPLTQNITPSMLNKQACLYGAIKMGLDRVEERITSIW